MARTSSLHCFMGESPEMSYQVDRLSACTDLAKGFRVLPCMQEEANSLPLYQD
jgi:hypothetical protein